MVFYIGQQPIYIDIKPSFFPLGVASPDMAVHVFGRVLIGRVEISL